MKVSYFNKYFKKWYFYQNSSKRPRCVPSKEFEVLLPKWEYGKFHGSTKILESYVYQSYFKNDFITKKDVFDIFENLISEKVYFKNLYPTSILIKNLKF